MNLFIDIAFLRGCGNELIVKELAFVQLRKSRSVTQSYVFKYPYFHGYLSTSVKRTNSWCAENLNNLRWCDGTVNYSELNNIFSDAVKWYAPRQKGINGQRVIFAKGSEKCTFLRRLVKVNRLSNTIVKDLDEYKCPKADSLYFENLTGENPFDLFASLECGFAHEGKECALNKAAKYNVWYETEVRSKCNTSSRNSSICCIINSNRRKSSGR